MATSTVVNHPPSASSASESVHLCEVGPRDGLQSIKTIMPTAQKIAWINGLAQAGFREIEIGSFVSPKLLPQMADTAEVARSVKKIHGLTVTALVPNRKGAMDALSAGVDKITLPVSASLAHSLANVRKTPQDMVDEVAQIVRELKDNEAQLQIEVGISTAFGCSIQGLVPEDDVIRLAEQLACAGATSIGLSDTTGMGNPAQVKRLFTRLQSAVGALSGGGHFHNTRGLGLANCLAAYDVGVRSFDSSMAGLGGCPYAPGASGNVVSEDLVFMFESMGIPTGVNLSALMALRPLLHTHLPDEPLYGMTPLAGVPAYFVQS